MPPKPTEMKNPLEFYNIDFSLNNQLRLAGAPTPKSEEENHRKYSVMLLHYSCLL